MLLTSPTCTPAFFASCAFARFSSSRVRANHLSVGTPSALFMAIHAFVLHGLPTTRIRTSSSAFFAMLCPCPMNILPFISRRSARSIPFLRGAQPSMIIQFAPEKPSSRSVVDDIELRVG